MDLAYWGFSHWPFQRHRLGGGSAIGASQEEALARLLFVVDERRHCGLLTGAAGTGKSRLFRMISDYARRQGHLCVDVNADGMGADELASRIADQLLVEPGSESPSIVWSGIQRRLVSQALVHQPVVLLIDHPDHSECGPALRRLLGLADSVDAPLTMLISSRTLALGADLMDQMELIVDLASWSQQETAQFISESLGTAGATKQIFSREAIAIVQEVSQGVPAQVNRICDLALIAAMGDDRHEVDAALVQAAIAEFSPGHSAVPRTARPAVPRELQGIPT